jgi:hypothetical protein
METLPSDAIVESVGVDGEEEEIRQDVVHEVGRLSRMLLDRLQQTSKAIVQVIFFHLQYSPRDTI